MADDGKATLQGSPGRPAGNKSVLQAAVTAFMAGEADLRAVQVALEASWRPSTTVPSQLLSCAVINEETWERCQQLHDAPFAAALFRQLLVGASPTSH